jgi:hypothetical protein
MGYVLLIMNCEKYRPKATVQKNTWLKQLPSDISFFHVLGKPDLASDYSFVFDERVLYVKTKDDYNSLPCKVICAYEAVLKSFPQCTYIFKTDDDQQLQNLRFFDMVKGMVERWDQKVHYGGSIVDVPKAYLSQYNRIHPELPPDLPILAGQYCSGRFYLLSREAASALVAKKDKFAHEYLEDYAISQHLPPEYKQNVLKINTDLFFKDMF